MDIPSYYFPGFPPLKDRAVRKSLNGYGMTSAVDVTADENGDINITPQRLYINDRNDSLSNLAAAQPTLPLLPPNNFAEPLTDPVIADRVKNKEELAAILNRLYRRKAQVSKKPALKKKLESFLSGNKEKLDKTTWSLIRDCKNKLFTPIYTPDANTSYIGGCVASAFKTETSSGVLMFPGGPQMSDIYFHEFNIEEDKFSMGGVIETCTAGSRVLSCQSTSVNNTNIFTCRTETQCQMFEVSNSDSNWTCHLLATKYTMASSISPSSMITGEAVLINKDRSILLWNAHKNSLEQIRDEIEPRFTCTDDYVQCVYGSHPRQIMVADATGVALIDSLQPARNDLDIFALPNPRVYLDERIKCIEHADSSGFYVAIATDNQLFVVDTRYPGHPVMIWDHMLQSPPQYVKQVNLYHDSLLLLASQRSHELVCFPYRVGYNGCPMQSTESPWRVSQISDFADIDDVYKCDSELFMSSDITQQRLNVSLVGIDAVVHPHAGVTFIQMTGVGDLFSQTYLPSADPQANKTCSTAIGQHDIALTQESLSRCQQYLDSLDHMYHQWHQQNTREKCGSEYKVGQFQNLYDLTLNIKPSFECLLCPPVHDPNATVTDHSVPDHHCPRCGHSWEDGEKLYQLGRENTYKSHGETYDLPNHIQNPNVERFQDPLSQMLLKEWSEEAPDLTNHQQRLDEVIKTKLKEFKKKKLGDKYVDSADTESDIEDYLSVLGDVEDSDVPADVLESDKFAEETVKDRDVMENVEAKIDQQTATQQENLDSHETVHSDDSESWYMDTTLSPAQVRVKMLQEKLKMIRKGKRTQYGAVYVKGKVKHNKPIQLGEKTVDEALGNPVDGRLQKELQYLDLDDDMYVSDSVAEGDYVHDKLPYLNLCGLSQVNRISDISAVHDIAPDSDIDTASMINGSFSLGNLPNVLNSTQHSSPSSICSDRSHRLDNVGFSRTPSRIKKRLAHISAAKSPLTNKEAEKNEQTQEIVPETNAETRTNTTKLSKDVTVPSIVTTSELNTPMPNEPQMSSTVAKSTPISNTKACPSHRKRKRRSHILGF